MEDLKNTLALHDFEKARHLVSTAHHPHVHDICSCVLYKYPVCVPQHILTFTHTGRAHVHVYMCIYSSVLYMNKSRTTAL